MTDLKKKSSLNSKMMDAKMSEYNTSSNELLKGFLNELTSEWHCWIQMKMK